MSARHPAGGDRRAEPLVALFPLGQPVSALLEVTDLSVGFRVPTPFWRPPAKVHAVQNVSFALGLGEVLGVVGESGSGKTTLGRAILRLIEPSGGAIRLAGERIDALPPGRMLPVRRRMQAVFQDPTASLNPAMTIGHAVGEGLAVHRIGDRADRPARVTAMLARVGLPHDAAGRRPQALSGGQRQRVGIARALIVEPDLLIADEAVSALDVSVQAGIVNLLMDLRAEMALSMLFIAHDLDLVRFVCDRVMVIYLGRVMEIGRTADVFAQPRHPYTRALIDAVPRIGARATARQLLTGDPPSPLAPPSGCVFRTRCPHAAPACAEAIPPLTGTSDGHATACIRQHEL
ncbi:ABC transporter ATP-binding protein [Sphingomonas nostoxanthinifaciens]|uniref:ABC transporter ATP-binding protein n=1 Tax=Sphingomonas nostoxanthinifaciens TaxID=2872652 RepID=UPI001CC21C37|nr:oligopeptide/dipeptide ABC transporter ATP-binding protein [Sphingomonas nostoxanthinifaciens]UAK23779.1 ATP-binding cassette domain-containing protein [Sphingomonas nostoxanthinifaciens]